MPTLHPLLHPLLHRAAKPLGAVCAFLAFSSLPVQAAHHAAAPAAPAATAPSALAPDPAAPDATVPRLRYRIAVDQGKWDEIHTEQWNLPDDVRNGIQSQLIDKLQKSGYFIVMERENGAMNQMSQEDQIAAKKSANLPQGATPVREQRTPAAYIITPSVIGFTQTSGHKNGINLGGISVGSSKTTATVTLNIRISNAQTSEMIDTQTATGTCDSKSTGFAIGGLYTNEQFQNSPAGQAVDLALDDAVAKIVARLSQEPWTALVAAQDKTTKRVIINAGTEAGVQVGQTFDVLRAGQPVTDPDTGDVISQGDEVPVGRIKIVRVTESAAYADVVSGSAFLPRDIVRQQK